MLRQQGSDALDTAVGAGSSLVSNVLSKDGILAAAPRSKARPQKSQRSRGAKKGKGAAAGAGSAPEGPRGEAAGIPDTDSAVPPRRKGGKSSGGASGGAGGAGSDSADGAGDSSGSAADRPSSKYLTGNHGHRRHGARAKDSSAQSAGSAAPDSARGSKSNSSPKEVDSSGPKVGFHQAACHIVLRSQP